MDFELLRPLDLGCWILDFRLWPLDFDLWTLDSGLWFLEFRSRFPHSPKSKVLGLWTLDLGLWVMDFAFSVLSLGLWALGFGLKILDFRFYIWVVCVFGLCIWDSILWALGFGREFWILGFGLCTLNFGPWSWGFGFRILNFKLGTVGIGRWPLPNWALDFRSWSLVIWNAGQGFCKGTLVSGPWALGYGLSILSFGFWASEI